MEKLTIIGSGLAGCMLSLVLAKRGYLIDVFESRSDLRKLSHDFGRSINLALSHRGISSLAQYGLMNDVDPLVVPMRARSIHDKQGITYYQEFGRSSEEYINAISRSELNKLLLNQLDSEPNVHIYFDHDLEHVNFIDKKISFKKRHGRVVEYDYNRLFGADGANSKVRENLSLIGAVKYTRDFLPHGYKELTIPCEYARIMDKERLHLWPRQSFMLLGNPNTDETITGTLFMPLEGQVSFAATNTKEKVTKLFKSEFPDVFPYMHDLLYEFENNPIGMLSTIDTTPWYYQEQCLLIGDAAHAIVPFFGQGMNSAFEDCRILDKILDKVGDNWGLVMPEFYRQRKLNTDSIAAMSMDNYRIIHQDVSDKCFVLRKALEHEMMRRYPKLYISMHVMVMFSNIPYVMAKECGAFQKRLLDELSNSLTTLEEVNWAVVEKKLRSYDIKMAGVAKKYKTILN
jgi:kynurenine 3-monooxygenase